jgi:hypothetical protein
MTKGEFEKAIELLTKEQLREIDAKLHFDTLDKDEMARKYAANYGVKPDFEAACVEVLREYVRDLKTEREKITHAAEITAKETAAIVEGLRQASRIAKEANSIAKWARGIAILSLALLVFMLLRGCVR